MNSRNLSNLMWGEALSLMEQAAMQALTLTSRNIQDGCLKLTFSKKESK